MVIRYYKICLLCGLALLLQGCPDDPELPPPDDSAEYFPIYIGMQNTFRTDSVVYDESKGEVFTYSSLLRETVVDSFEDVEGDIVYTVRREVGDTLGQDFEFHDLLSMSADEDRAIRTEDNLRYVKLEFPLYEGREWEGNRYINTEIVIFVAGESLQMFKFWPKYYTATEIEQDVTIGDITYDEVLTVLHVDEDSRIERRYSIEKYARHIGLVYREQWILDTQCKEYPSLEDCIPVPWEVKAEKGFILRQTRVE